MLCFKEKVLYENVERGKAGVCPKAIAFSVKAAELGDIGSALLMGAAGD